MCRYVYDRSGIENPRVGSSILSLATILILSLSSSRLGLYEKNSYSNSSLQQQVLSILLFTEIMLKVVKVVKLPIQY